MKQIRSFIRKVLFYFFIPVIVISAIYLLFFKSSTAVYTAPDVVEVITTKEVNHLDPLYEERQQELEDRYREIANIEAQIDVNQTEIERLSAENRRLTTELADFMTATE